MKKLVLILAGAGLCVWLSLVGFEYYRESQVLKSSGIGVSRSSVDLLYKNGASINFGADSTTELIFSLPPGISGTKRCNELGYSEVALIDLGQILKLPGAPKEKLMGCVRHVISDHGKTTTFVLLDRKIAIKIMV